jgi:hypothetical protein
MSRKFRIEKEDFRISRKITKSSQRNIAEEMVEKR